MILPNTRPDERFFFSAWIPRCYLVLNLGVMKLSIWGPYPFISLAVGWFAGQGPQVRALQMYLGIKCDPTQSLLHGQTNQDAGPLTFVMVLTPKELAAFRIHHVSVESTWSNQGGQ